MTDSLNRIFEAAVRKRVPFDCPRCRRLSYLTTDRVAGYCAWCHAYTGKRTLKGFSVAVTRDAIAEVEARADEVVELIQTRNRSAKPTSALDLYLASLLGFRADLRQQLREVGEEP